MTEIDIINEPGVKLKCFVCNTVTHRPNKCSDCGYDRLEWRSLRSGGSGIFCPRCDRGYTSWNCASCRKSNGITGGNVHIKHKPEDVAVARWFLIILVSGIVFLWVLVAIKNMPK
jgi:hypothetical protein